MSRRPVLIGWAQACRFDGEPLEAWAHVLRETGVAPAEIDSLDVLYCQSWPYDDPAGRLASAVGADPKRREYSGIGGTTPLSLLAAASERVLTGQSDVCAVVAGEALATVRNLKKEGARPQWSHRDPEKKPFPFEAPFQPSEVAHQIFQAYTTFAMRDVARRAHLGQSVEEYRRGIGSLFALMTEVAATNPYAWFPTARTASELVDATPANRVVAHPYTKLVTSIMDVDLASAYVVASEEAADRLGVPVDERVYVRGWGEGRDPDYVAEHDELWRAPAMHQALQGALDRAGVGVDDVARFDLYSCFPASVAFTLDALGLAADDGRGPFTVTGGLPYAGGPGSGYAVGSVAAMAASLVADPGSVGLVTAVGMHLSKHAGVVLSTRSGELGAPAPQVGQPVRRPIADTVDGAVTIAAYTVHHGGDGAPTEALLVCDVADVAGGGGGGGAGGAAGRGAGRGGGARCYAKSTDAGLLAAMEAEEFVGRTVTLRSDGAVNWVQI